MTRLMTIDNNLISEKITDILISPEIIKVRNQLIDGSYHVQSIGDPHKVINISCDITEQQKTTLENAYIIDKPLRVERDDKYYIGLLQDKPTINNISISLSINSRIYSTQLIIVVNEEGDI